MSDSPTSPSTEPTSQNGLAFSSFTGGSDTPIPVKEETAVPVTAETSIPVSQENSIPVTEEPTIPVTDDTAIPMDNISSDVNSREPNSLPDLEVENDLNPFVDNISWGLQAFTGLSNVSTGILVFFLQFWALLISSANVDKDPTGLLAGIYLIMLAGLVIFKKLGSIDVTRCLSLLAIIMGITLVSLHSWSIYLCKNLYDYCTTFQTAPETLDISAVASCRWFTQRVIIDSLMVGCGVLIILSNGVFLFFASVHKSTKP